MLEVSKTNNKGFNKIVLEPANEGTYVFVYQTKDSESPERDYLEDNTLLAKALCLSDFGTPLESWDYAPNIERLMA